LKIAIVNDVATVTEALRRAVASSGHHEIIWTAANGREALERCQRERPQLLLMDLIMPIMDGVEATRLIMATCPCAILIVTADVGYNASKVFEAMGEGALDAIDTPQLGLRQRDRGPGYLLSKIDSLERVIADRCSTVAAKAASPLKPAPDFPLIAIGASAGGPAALATLLSGLPRNPGAAIAIVQHVDAQFASGMAAWLEQHSGLSVRVAQEGEVLQANQVYLAGSNDHLVLKSPHHLGYTSQPEEYVYRPSVDVFFQSICQQWCGDVIGVLLTGMGCDGAQGLKLLRNLGFHTIAQDEQSCAVYGMPKAAAKLGAAAEILPLTQIAAHLIASLAVMTAKGH
tara:strand:- start:44224 stop:45252 length:1029 start_codon:yes stop_codon:yes gene_type:complete